MISLSVAPEEGRKIKRLVTDFLYATHGYWGVKSVELDSIKKQQNQIEIHGKYDAGGLVETKWVHFTIVFDTQYRLISYERG